MGHYGLLQGYLYYLVNNIYNKEMLYLHCFSTLLYNMPLGRSKNTRWD
jgi:hypothetical protein